MRQIYIYNNFIRDMAYTLTALRFELHDSIYLKYNLESTASLIPGHKIVEVIAAFVETTIH